MKFYNRINELKSCEKQDVLSRKSGIMSVFTGRRRIGKTLLALEFCKNKKYLYLFVSKKAEALLCEDFSRDIESALGVPVVGKIDHFGDLFRFILEYAQQHKITVVIDEFQEFFNINPSVYSDVQKWWDLYKSKSKVHVIFIGSVYSLMHKIFENKKEPLFGRADRLFHIKPFDTEAQAEILGDYRLSVENHLFDFFLFTGGVAKYYDILLKARAKNKSQIIDCILEADSPFLYEGRNLLIEEFGKSYSIYFSILQLIASGKTSRSAIESVIQKDVGGYLARLESDYHLIKPCKPFDAKPGSRTQKYGIIDNFLNVWFTFIFENLSAIEMGNFDYVKRIIERDYDTFAGKGLERFFCQRFEESGEFNRVGQYWEKGNQNEIDLVAANDLDKKLVIADIKLKSSKINLKRLEQKAQKLVEKYKGYDIRYIGLSLDDV